MCYLLSKSVCSSKGTQWMYVVHREARWWPWREDDWSRQYNNIVQVLVSIVVQATLSSSQRLPQRPSRSRCRLGRQIGNVHSRYRNSRKCAPWVQEFSEMGVVGTRNNDHDDHHHHYQISSQIFQGIRLLVSRQQNKIK
jgi:hypothetical protein